jgi:hypothetical protein
MVNPTQRETKFRIGHKNPVVQLLYPRNNDRYTRAEILKMVKKQQKKYIKSGKKLNFMILIDIPDRGWRSGKQFKIGEQANLPDKYDDEYSDSKQFSISVWHDTAPAGGKTKHNDCFYLALLRGMNGNIRWKNAYRFKRAFDIDRDDLVPLSLIPEIEDKCKTNINVSGDYVFSSQCKYSTTLQMKLVNEHYTLDTSHKDKKILHGLTYKEKQIIIAKRDNETKMYNCYDGNNVFNITDSEFYDSRKNNYASECTYVTVRKGENIEEYYDTYMKDIESIRIASNDVINLKKCSGDVRRAVLQLFYNTTLAIDNPDPITPLEEHWINSSFQGGLVYGKSVELNDATCYDVNSAYPFFISKSSFKIPLKQGTFKKIKELDKILLFGIYRIVIHESSNKDTNKMFRFNSKHYYTHYDVYNARNLNLEMELMQNQESNVLVYDASCCVNASKMFKPIVDYLYAMKVNKIPMAKRMLNTLWGGLCKRNHRYVKVMHDGDVVTLPENIELTNISLGSDNDLVRYVEKGKFYDLPYARLGPFLTSAVRKFMSDTMAPYKERIHRIHTDGFVVENTIDLKLSQGLGAWKIENQGPCKIINSCIVLWNT